MVTLRAVGVGATGRHVPHRLAHRVALLLVRLATLLVVSLVVVSLAVVPPASATPAADLAEAEQAVQAGEIHRALELYRQVASDPGSGPGAEALAALCQLSPDADEAVEAATLLLEHHRDHPLAWHAAELLGHFRAAGGAYRSAARLFASAAAQLSDGDPAHDRLELLRGRALLGAGEASEAREVFDAIIRRRHGDAMAAAALLGAGDAALMRADHGEAARIYREYLARFPHADGVPVALSQLARAFDQAAAPDSALATLGRLVADYPESIEAAAARDRLREHQAARGGAGSPGDLPVLEQDAPRGHYALQAGAFGREENAQELARHLQELGLPDVRIERELRDDGKVFYRVRLGAYRDPEEAEAAGQELRAKHGLVCTVVLR
ncbi:MAG: SPOR domain-containing protein [Candidatus Eiseniibacteriota bacterium]|jgi:TolA-binding protein